MGGHMLPSSPFWQQSYSFDVFCRIRTVWSKLGILRGGLQPATSSAISRYSSANSRYRAQIQKVAFGPFLQGSPKQKLLAVLGATAL